MPPRAKTILRESLSDIDAGRWCQSDLAIQEYVPDNGDERPTDKLMGCAIGLVAMHGGVGKRGTLLYVNPETGVEERVAVFYPDYPETNSPRGVLTAVDALYAALPKSKRLTDEQIDRKVEQMQKDGKAPDYTCDISALEVKISAIVDHNDKGSTSRLKARRWFADAFELVS